MCVVAGVLPRTGRVSPLPEEVSRIILRATIWHHWLQLINELSENVLIKLTGTDRKVYSQGKQYLLSRSRLSPITHDEAAMIL